MRDIFVMREVAQHIDARNRVIPAEPTPSYPRCRTEGCTSTLTVSDRGNVCRQCKAAR